jgi:hypothetical protein
MRSNGVAHHNLPLPSAASSACSDLREVNEAKVANILSYLDGMTPHMGGGPLFDPRQSYSHDMDEQSPFRLSTTATPPPAPINPQRNSWTGGGNASVASGITNITTENQVYSGIKSKVDALRSTCDALQKENAALHAKIADDRKRYEATVRSTRDTAKHELDDALQQIRQMTRQHGDATKKIIMERDAFKQALDEVTHKYNRELSTKKEDRDALEDAHATAISQLKARWMAQEKSAREKWKEKEVKDMKQNTLKALQPDIEFLMKRHNAEKARLEEQFQDELKRKEKQLIDKEAAFEELKGRIQAAADSRIAHERQLADDRARDEVQRMQRVVEEAGVLAEKKRDSQRQLSDEREQSLRHDIKKLEEELFQMRRRDMEGTAQFRDAVSSEVSKLSATQEAHLQSIKDQLAKDHQKAKELLEVDNRRMLATKEEEIRAKCKLELDRAVVQTQERLEDAYIQKVKEMKESDRLVREKISRQEYKIEQLNTDLELAQSQLKTSLDNLRKKDETIVCLQRDLSAAKDTQEMLKNGQEKEFDNRLRFLDGQWLQRLRQLEMDKVDAINELQHQMRKEKLEWDEMRNVLESDIRGLEQKHNSELSGINDKVLVAVSSREGVIRQLHERIAALEGMLRDRDVALDQHRALLDG